jgi:ABC-2 type transport system ATP-binding protein
VIDARQLTKRFGGRTAIEDVTFAVGRGEVVGFLGPNGAGKTTTLRLLAGVLPPTAGQVRIDGIDLARAPLAARRRLGYVPERPALYPEMTVDALLAFAAAMKDVGGAARRRTAIDATLTCTGLETVRGRRVGALSRGFQQRVSLALALVSDPPVLLLDEPTAGLDPEQSAETRRLIRTLREGRALLVSSHALVEVEAMADRVVILHRGRVIAADRPARLAARLRPASRIDVEVLAPAAALAAALAAVPGVRRVDPLGTGEGPVRCRLEVEPGEDVRAALAARIVTQGWDLLALTSVEPSLEEAFLTMVAGADDGGGDGPR